MSIASNYGLRVAIASLLLIGSGAAIADSAGMPECKDTGPSDGTEISIDPDDLSDPGGSVCSEDFPRQQQRPARSWAKTPITVPPQPPVDPRIYWLDFDPFNVQAYQGVVDVGFMFSADSTNEDEGAGFGKGQAAPPPVETVVTVFEMAYRAMPEPHLPPGPDPGVVVLRVNVTLVNGSVNKVYVDAVQSQDSDWSSVAMGEAEVVVTNATDVTDWGSPITEHGGMGKRLRFEPTMNGVKVIGADNEGMHVVLPGPNWYPFRIRRGLLLPETGTDLYVKLFWWRPSDFTPFIP